MESFVATQSKNRMILLLRNSSKKQAEKVVREDGRIEYDIPLQRSILRPWAERLGYEVVGELVEGGVSGYKVSAEKRDAVIELKARADRGEFDVLGIYMSDRLGRIADETPLIVSFLNARGIKVLSYSDDEISSVTHNDKLMTYIRFWQAEGESLKTSMRIKDAHEKAVEQGKWRGGNPPYGYKTVSRGTLNGKGRPIFDIEINPEQAMIVKKIFKLYTEHYGTKAIAKLLNDTGVPTCKGALWSNGTVQAILKNKLYTGIYELGKTVRNETLDSPIMDHLRFISEEEYDEAQRIREENRKNKNIIVGKRPTVRGSRLLSGLLYCECGQKHTSQRTVSRQARKDGSVRVHEYNQYRCGSYRHPRENQCNKGRLDADKLDKTIAADAKNFLQEIDIEKLLRSHDDIMHEKEQELSAHLKMLTREKSVKEKEVQKLKDEVLKVIMGESQFSQSLLSEMVATKEQEMKGLQKKYDEADGKAEVLRASISARKATCEDLSDWANRFDAQDTMTKKSMLINLIDRITVYDKKIRVNYKVKLVSNNAKNGKIDAFLCSKLVQRGTQSKIPMRQ